MGQLFSCFLRPSRAPPSSPLLELPVEIILSIASWLHDPPESIISLSLTCKSLFFILDKATASIRTECRHELLPLLEKDLGHRFFYCAWCRQLHRFSPQWNPLTSGPHRYVSTSPVDHHEQFFNPNILSSSRYDLYVCSTTVLILIPRTLII